MRNNRVAGDCQTPRRPWGSATGPQCTAQYQQREPLPDHPARWCVTSRAMYLSCLRWCECTGAAPQQGEPLSPLVFAGCRGVWRQFGWWPGCVRNGWCLSLGQVWVWAKKKAVSRGGGLKVGFALVRGRWCAGAKLVLAPLGMSVFGRASHLK